MNVNTNENIEYLTLNNSGIKLTRAVKQKIKCGGKQVKTIINFIARESKTKEFKGKNLDMNKFCEILLKKYGLETWYNVSN
ncbi:MAG: hypothetical protein WCJ95_19445 [Mariniphaga sp.]